MKANVTRERLLRFKMVYVDDEEVEEIEKELTEIEEKSKELERRENGVNVNFDIMDNDYFKAQCNYCKGFLFGDEIYCSNCGTKLMWNE